MKSEMWGIIEPGMNFNTQDGIDYIGFHQTTSTTQGGLMEGFSSWMNNLIILCLILISIAITIMALFIIFKPIYHFMKNPTIKLHEKLKTFWMAIAALSLLAIPIVIQFKHFSSVQFKDCTFAHDSGFREVNDGF